MEEVDDRHRQVRPRPLAPGGRGTGGLDRRGRAERPTCSTSPPSTACSSLRDAARAPPSRLRRPRSGICPCSPRGERQVLDWSRTAPLRRPCRKRCSDDPWPVRGAGRPRPDAVAWCRPRPTAARRDLRRARPRPSRLARRLRALGVGPECRSASAWSAPPAWCAALLAVLKAGAPTCPSTPTTRRSAWPSCSPTPARAC